MPLAFNRKTDASAARYSLFLEMAAAQAADLSQTNPLDISARESLIVELRDAGARFITTEQSYINDDTLSVAIAANNKFYDDAELEPVPMDDRFANFIYSASLYSTQLISAQITRDIAALSQNLRTTSQRVDLYVRAGASSVQAAIGQLAFEARLEPKFTFMDRIGRRYQSTKHMRDIYRHHLLSIYNEVYLDVAAQHGRETLFVEHPDPNYRYQGQPLSITGQSDHPLYYDMRDEIFHPSSEALLSVLETI